jgi:CRISPR type III-A-associated protein Csm2
LGETVEGRNQGGAVVRPDRDKNKEPLMSDKSTEPNAEDSNSFFEASSDQKRCLKLQFVDRIHMEPKAKAMASAGLNMTQLNRFFRHCRRIELRLRRKEIEWDQDGKTEVALLCAHAADAYTKKPPKIPTEFKDFIDENVGRIHNEEDFLRGFMKHFEALMGFASVYARPGGDEEA